ncbi:Hsp33 family molecular chaperone HslO [Slackia heliotrinireducens]|uniref:Hsp33 family molecular chaperone HslO n=1 Tax=Slackia heliotrinireducens TaxID=84110 RepID=UPI0033149D42
MDNVIDFEHERTAAGDYIVRGVAGDGQIRAFAITARESVQEASTRHHTSPVATAALGRLLMAGQMMGWMFKNPDELITLTLEGDGPLCPVTVTADSTGRAKGYVAHPNVWLDLNSKRKLDVGVAVGSGMLLVVRDQPGIEPYSSRVELVSGEIGDDLVHYFVTSDQVPTTVGLGVLVDRDLSVRQAGGFIIQLMPHYDDEVVDRLEQNLAGVSSVTDMLEQGMTPEAMLERLLAGLDPIMLETTPASFYCGCNAKRAQRAVLALGASEIKDMIEKNEPAEVYCHFCGDRYEFTPDELSAMLGFDQQLS